MNSTRYVVTVNELASLIEISGKSDEQKRSCMSALEPVVADLIKRGAFRGVVATALIELSLQITEDAADKVAFQINVASSTAL